MATLRRLVSATAVVATLASAGAARTATPPLPGSGGLAARAAMAERLAREAARAVRLAREHEPASHAGHGLDADRAALIGSEHSLLVTTLGSLESKQLATDPRWAAVLVRQLAAHGVEPGTTVTASFSGSFPGLNLAVMAACRALDAQLVAVSSVTASTWGANEPGATWPEMEVAIVGAGVLPPASRGISIGGGRDRGRDLQPEGLDTAMRIQARSARALGAHVLATATLAEAIRARLAVYREALGGKRPVVYVNVGGNHASLGGADAPLRHDEGWVLTLPSGADRRASVTHAFLADGVPVLSLLNVKALARRWNLDDTR